MAKTHLNITCENIEMGGYKSEIMQSHTCKNCGRDFTLSIDEHLYTYPPYYNKAICSTTGKRYTWNSNVALVFCCYNCRSEFIKNNPDKIEKINNRLANTL